MAPSPAATFAVLWHSLAPHGDAPDHVNSLTRHTQLYCCLTALSHSVTHRVRLGGGRGGAAAALADSNSAQRQSTLARAVQHGWRSPWRGLRAFTRLADAGWLNSGLGGRNGGVGTPGSAVLSWSRSGGCLSLRLCSLVALFPHVRPGEWLRNQKCWGSQCPGISAARCRRSSALASSGGETRRCRSPSHPVRMFETRVALGRDAHSFVPRRWAQGRGPQLGADAAVQRVDATMGWRTAGVRLGGHDRRSVKSARK